MREKQDVEKDNRVSAKHSALAHSRISNGGGVGQEFQHRNVAHHRDVHDPRPSLHRP